MVANCTASSDTQVGLPSSVTCPGSGDTARSSSRSTTAPTCASGNCLSSTTDGDSPRASTWQKVATTEL